MVLEYSETRADIGYKIVSKTHIESNAKLTEVRILNLKEKKRLAESKYENMITKRHPKTVRTQTTLKKAKSLILKESQPTQRFFASKLGMSLPALQFNSFTKI
ncbi:hypothetical protein TNCV_2127971 [Trichonephila clavipes]|nr:hypothetical protein TNCV_2127971 [Trichonephila clavipes]